MQYTATTFANPTRVTFDRFYRPDIKVDRASEDPAGSSGPVHYRLKVKPLFEDLIYRPMVRLVRRVAGIVEPVQSGDVNWYLFYLLVAVVVAYFVAAR
jgi:hydrogenase-4 component B